MINYQPLKQLPQDIQQDFRATLQQAVPTEQGAFHLVGIRRTRPRTFEEQRLIVSVVDENGFPVPTVQVAFSYSTARFYTIGEEFLWQPPQPQNAFTVITQGSGQCDMILGPEGIVKEGQAGGVTVYCLEPEYSSDVVTGLGMTADHAGLALTFQLLRVGVRPLAEWLAEMEQRLAKLEAGRE